MRNTKKDWDSLNEKYFHVLMKFIFMPLLLAGVAIFFLHSGIGILLMVGACFVLVLGVFLLVLLKPLLVKKYPENLPSRSVPVSDPSLVVDTGKPYEALSKIHKLAVDRFSGRVDEAIVYIFRNHETAEELNTYVEEFTQAEALFSLKFIDRHISENVPREEIRRVVDLEFSLNAISMTEQQVLESRKNPFVAPAWRRAGLFLLFAVCSGAVGGLGERYLGADPAITTVTAALGILSTIFAFRVAEPIMNAFHFRKAKRLLMQTENTSAPEAE